ncbi:MAG: pantoate--beta-alanine ligase [Actinobacteria bacterium]|nr:pantoate--beta-alanine ligase [Actinomycetota bacterium]
MRDAAEFRAAADDRREAGGTAALVPTMGALHEGHVSLIRRARAEHAWCAVSIFVNPLQFGPDEDLGRYPRDEPADLAVCERLGVDAVWAPTAQEMYPPGVLLPSPEPGPIGDVLEGASRPGHFRGVLKAVHRLFDACGPCTAYFGEKDAQQLFLVRRMVSEERLPVTVVGSPTVREPGGLACSSRNAQLSAKEREQAACLFLALTEAAELARGGERDAAVLVAAMAREIGATALAHLDYATVVADDTFEEIRAIDRPARALVAARFPSARLIDNLRLPSAKPATAGS